MQAIKRIFHLLCFESVVLGCHEPEDWIGSELDLRPFGLVTCN